MTEAGPAGAIAWLCAASGATDAAVLRWERLSGGAIQQNWRLDLQFEGGTIPGAQSLVLRTDAPSSVSVSRTRAEEFALLRAAFAAGVSVPEPLFLCSDPTVTGRPFFVMRRAEGIAAGHRVVKSETLGGGREALATALGRELARIHTIRPPRADLAFLPPVTDPAGRLIGIFRAALDRAERPRPVLEWALRHLERRRPAPGEIVLCHNDFRTGNYLVTEARITAVLDWEFASWGDRLEDIGWLCARCWRFGNTAQEAGGVGSRAAFYAGYEAASGWTIDRAAVPYWEAAATLRWAVIAIEQAARHVSGAEQNLELALTGHIVPELELDLLAMVGEG